MPVLKQRIFGLWLHGVPERTLSQEYLITRPGIEEILRECVLAMRKGAVAGAACLLMLCTSVQAFQEAFGHDEPVSVQRAFRTPRTRRGRRDGDAPDSIWQDAPAWERAA